MGARSLILTSLVACIFPLAGRAEDAVDFSREIRPILADNCLRCHGPDEKSRKAGLRLDSRQSVLAERDGVRAVVPGKPSESELFRRISSQDEDERMPREGKPLPAAQIEQIRRWIEQGAAWEEHWAFVAPRRPELPAVREQARVVNAVDSFIIARLEREGLTLSEEADPRILIRRLTLDLTGLPPTPGEVESFLADTAPDAYERLVDRLLDSPQYGEHMARYWLDAVRYGDTHGLHLDNYREMWPYRDWVIRAFNCNLSFAEFTVDQIAGDLLPGATLEQQVASGYNRCHVTTNEGGSIPEEVYVRNVVDRVQTTSTVFMGLTLGCAVCHEHKFDPFRQEEFYQLFAFFNNLDGKAMDGNLKDPAPVVRVPSPRQKAELAALDARLAGLEEKIAGPLEEVDRAQLAWETEIRKELDSPVEWLTLDPESFESEGGATLTELDDRSILASGKNPAKEVYDVVASLPGEGFRSIRLEGLTDDSLSARGAGRSANSNVVLTEFEAEVRPSDRPGAFEAIEFTRAWADHEQGDGDFKIANAIDGKPDTGWATEGHKKRENRVAIFTAGQPFGFQQGATLRVKIRHESIYAQHQFGRLRLSVTRSETIPNSGAVPGNILDIVRIDPGKRDAAQSARLRKHYRDRVSDDAALKKLRDELAAATKERKSLLGRIPTTLVMKERAQPRDAFVLIRGQYDRRGAKVERRTPAALPPMKEGLPRDRLGFARWLVDPAHPLTARVTVNRFWQQLFGTGIVKTAEDFGTRGEPPSHRELLDWLAVDFVESGWDVKRLMKLMVMSASYRQSSRVTPQLLAKDPENRLLARGPRFRLDAETLRDQALAVSGLLVETIGGPSVKPPQPDGLWHAVGYTSSNTAHFKADTGDRIYRRSVYTFWKRTAPPPQMRTLDAPSRESCTVRRERTNTPLQALLLMNESQYIEAARHLAQRAMTEGGDTPHSRAAFAFRLVTLREPSEADVAEMVAAYRDHLAEYRRSPEDAASLISVGESKPDPRLDPSELAAWTLVANLILNLDEVVTKE